MNLTKDVYEYLLNFADDREILNMLSVNKKFRDEKLFERVMRRRYPLVTRFKDEEKSWREFYIETIFYLAKLKENFDLSYVPTLDFNPKTIYKNSRNRKFASIFIRVKGEIDRRQNRGYHTIAYKGLNDKYKIDPNLHKGHSMTYFGIVRPENENEIVIDDFLLVEGPTVWLTLEAEDGRDENSSHHSDKEEAIKFLFNNYNAVIQEFIEEMMAVNVNVDILQYSNLDKDWANFEKFREKIETDDYPVVILYKNLPNMDSKRYDFRLVKVNVPK